MKINKLIFVSMIVASFVMTGCYQSPQISRNDNHTSTQPTPSGSGEATGKTVTFYCADNKSIVATFYPSNDTKVDLKLSDGRSLSVPHAISASGARYANADESFVFWNKGTTAFITEGKDFQETFADCNETSAPAPTPDAGSVLYETKYLKISVPDGWTAKEATKVRYEGTKKIVEPNPAAVNIVKGKYILYINAQAQQASGVEGGRFAEIAMGAPSADAIVTMQPSDPCGTSEERPVFDGHTRYDWYVSKNDAREWCAGPKDASTVWYFSYVSRTGGYINYYNRSDEPPGYVITLAYNSKDIASFPKKDSPELSQIFDQVSAILQTLALKHS